MCITGTVVSGKKSTGVERNETHLLYQIKKPATCFVRIIELAIGECLEFPVGLRIWLLAGIQQADTSCRISIHTIIGNYPAVCRKYNSLLKTIFLKDCKVFVKLK